MLHALLLVAYRLLELPQMESPHCVENGCSSEPVTWGPQRLSRLRSTSVLDYDKSAHRTNCCAAFLGCCFLLEELYTSSSYAQRFATVDTVPGRNKVLDRMLTVCIKLAHRESPAAKIPMLLGNLWSCCHRSSWFSETLDACVRALEVRRNPFVPTSPQHFPLFFL